MTSATLVQGGAFIEIGFAVLLGSTIVLDVEMAVVLRSPIDFCEAFACNFG